MSQLRQWIKEYKHLEGKHNQKAHGHRGAEQRREVKFRIVGDKVDGSLEGVLKNGTVVYKANRLDNLENLRDQLVLVVAIKGPNKNTILISNTNSHSEAIHTVFGDKDNVDNYVRFRWLNDKYHKGPGTLAADTMMAGSLDAKEGEANIYAALKKLAYRGVPGHVRVEIGSEYVEDSPFYYTTVKEYTLKHLQGLHNQKRHGNRGAKVSQAASAGYVAGRQLSMDDIMKVVEAPDFGSRKNIQQDEWLGAAIIAQGFDGKPQIVTKAAMDVLVQGGSDEMWRGVRDVGGLTAKDIHNQLTDGEFYIGSGIYGNGTYLTNKSDTAAGYGPSLIRSTPRKEAKVADYFELEKQMQAEVKKKTEEFDIEVDKWYSRISEVGKSGDKEKYNQLREEFYDWRNRENRLINLLNDSSVYAVMKGIDVVKMPRGDSGESYYIVLNRTAMAIQKPFYTAGKSGVTLDETTIKEVVLKHLTGEHNQKKHGNRGTRVSQEAISGLSKDAQSFYSKLDTKSQVKFRLAWYRETKKNPNANSDDFVKKFTPAPAPIQAPAAVPATPVAVASAPKPTTPAAKPVVAQTDAGGRAAGGVITAGINARSYAGGQFLPNTTQQNQAKWAKLADANAKAYMEKKQEIAPYEWTKPSTELERAIFPRVSGQMRGVYFSRAKKQWSYDKNSTFLDLVRRADGEIDHYEQRPLDQVHLWTLPDGTRLNAKNLLDLYNSGTYFLPIKDRADELERIRMTGSAKVPK